MQTAAVQNLKDEGSVGAVASPVFGSRVGFRLVYVPAAFYEHLDESDLFLFTFEEGQLVGDPTEQWVLRTVIPVPPQGLKIGIGASLEQSLNGIHIIGLIALKIGVHGHIERRIRIARVPVIHARMPDMFGIGPQF